MRARGPLFARARPVPPRATSRACRARDWTLLVQGVNLHERRGRRAAAALRVHSVRAPRRRDGELRGARRRRRPARRLVRRVPAAGHGPAALALRPAGRPRAAARRAAEDPAALRRRQHDATLAPGDMLYLPPGSSRTTAWRSTNASTYSIGFRAPLDQELAEAFLDHLRDALDVAGRYADPDLRADPRARRASTRRCSGARERDRAHPLERGRTIARFLGRFLTEPKPDVVFAAPRALRRARFRRARCDAPACASTSHAAPLRSRALYINGDGALRRRTIGPRCDGSPTPRADARAMRSAVAGNARPSLRLVSTWLPPPPDTRCRRRPACRAKSGSTRSPRKSHAHDDVIALARRHIQVFDIDLSGAAGTARRAATRSSRSCAACPARASTSSFTTRAGSRRPAPALHARCSSAFARDDDLAHRRGRAHAMDPLLIVDDDAFRASLPHRPRRRRRCRSAARSARSRSSSASTRSGRRASPALPGRCSACSRQRSNDRLKWWVARPRTAPCPRGRPHPNRSRIPTMMKTLLVAASSRSP